MVIVHTTQGVPQIKSTIMETFLDNAKFALTLHLTRYKQKISLDKTNTIEISLNPIILRAFAKISNGTSPCLLPRFRQLCFAKDTYLDIDTILHKPM